MWAANIIFDYTVTLKMKGEHDKSAGKKRAELAGKLTQQLGVVAALVEGGS